MLPALGRGTHRVYTSSLAFQLTYLGPRSSFMTNMKMRGDDERGLLPRALHHHPRVRAQAAHTLISRVNCVPEHLHSSRDPSTDWRCHSAGAGGASQ